MITYKAKTENKDLRNFTDPKIIMKNLYKDNLEGFTDPEIKNRLKKNGFKITKCGVMLLRDELNKRSNKVININGEKRRGFAVWKWRGLK